MVFLLAVRRWTHCVLTKTPNTHHSGFMAQNPEDYSFESQHYAISMYCITNVFDYQPTKYPE